MKYLLGMLLGGSVMGVVLLAGTVLAQSNQQSNQAQVLSISSVETQQGTEVDLTILVPREDIPGPTPQPTPQPSPQPSSTQSILGPTTTYFTHNGFPTSQGFMTTGAQEVECRWIGEPGPNQQDGGVVYRHFDGSDGCWVGSSSYWSRGDGYNDQPFSIGVWVAPETCNQNFLSKYSIRTGLEQREWTTQIDGKCRQSVSIRDESTGGKIGRNTTGVVSGMGDWMFLTWTYDGSGLESGVRFYRNGMRVDNQGNSNGSYTAMEGTGEEVRLCYFEGASGSPSEFCQGKVAGGELSPFFTHKWLSDQEVGELFNIGEREF